MIRSTDKGVTWSAPIDDLRRAGDRRARSRERNAVRDGSNLGSIAAGPGNTLVAVWQDARFSGGARDGIALVALDRRRPHMVRAGARQPRPDRAGVRADGRRPRRRHDRRHVLRLPQQHDGPSTLFTDYWLARSSDGVNVAREPRRRAVRPRHRAERGRPVPRRLPGARSAIGTEFVPFYAAVNTGDTANRTDVFASLVTSAGTAARAAAARATGHADEDSYVAGAASPLPVDAGACEPPDRQHRAHDGAACAGMAAAGIDRPPEPD